MLRLRKGTVLLTLLALVAAAVAITGCSRSPQEKEAAFLKRGKALLEKNDYQHALLEFANAAKVMPKDAEAFYQLGLAYWSTSRLNEAYAAFKKAAELNPRHGGAQAKLAELMTLARDQGTAEQAEQHAEQAAAVSPQEPEALYALALTEYRLGREEDASAALRKNLERFPKNLQSSVGLADIHLSHNDYAGAAEVLKKAVADAPDSADAAMALGRVYEMSGKDTEAETEYRRVLQLNSKRGEALLRMGALQLKAGRKAEAEQCYRQASNLPDKEFRAAYAFFLVDQGKLDLAGVEFQKLAKEDPKDRVARSRLVTAYIALKKLNQAEEILDKAIKVNPKDAAALFQRAEVSIEQHRYKQAQDDLGQVLHFEPDRAEAHYLLAESYQAQGKDLLARQELNETLRLKPQMLAARIRLAYALVAAKEGKTALQLLDQVPEGQASAPEVTVTRNWALMAMRNTPDARKGIDRGLATSKNPDLLLQDAVLKLQQKDYPQARAVLDSILNQNPANAGALEALARSYVEQNQAETAVQKVRQYADAASGSYPLQIFAGNWFLKNGKTADARKAFSAAKAANPPGTVPDLGLAQVDLGERKVEDARNRLSAVLVSDRENLAAHFLLAVLEENTGNYASAITHYRRVVELDPKQSLALNALAYLLGGHTDQIDEALKYAQQAKELSPAEPAVDDTLGWILCLKGQNRSALDYLTKAAAKSKNPVIGYHLAIACFKTGDVDRGLHAMDSALKANASLPEAALAQKALSAATRRSK